MKEYVLILLFTRDYKKVLLMRRKKDPYKNCWNGIGGKIEENETEVEAAIRECKEETGITLENPKLLVTYKYPETSIINSNTTLNVLYDFVDEIKIEENHEGTYEWKAVEFAMDFNNKEMAGLANVSQFVKEIYHIENIIKFYN